jgi:2-methylcitrate dehydratase PrpD
MTSTQQLARLIAHSEVEPTARDAAREALIDYLACAIAGARDPGIDRLLAVLTPALGPAALIGRSGSIDALTAALINGYAGHVLDFDDVHASVRGHTSTVLFPALLGCASLLFAEGHLPSAGQLLDASVIGVETMGLLGLALGPDHYEAGFHATATLGAIGAAAASSALLGLNERETAIALGLAATQSAGLRSQFGSDGKPLHAGLAARSGLMSALLARAGFQGASEALDGPNGFLSAFSAQTPALDRWGTPWQILSPGLLFKRFPSCTASHGAAAAALDLHAEHGPFALEDVAAITLTFPPGGDAALVVREPRDGIEGRFSVEYVMAIGLLRGRFALSDFGERPIAADARALAAKMTRAHDLSAPRLSGDPGTRFVTVVLHKVDGTRLSRRIDGLPGAESLDAKFTDLVEGTPHAAALLPLIRSMADAQDLRALLSAVAHRTEKSAL